MLLDGNPLRVWNLAQVQQKLGISAGSPLFQLAVAAGEVPGVVLSRLMGHNPDVDTVSVPEDIWEGGGLYPFQSAAVALEVVSSSVNDAAAGTGLRTVTVTGLDTDYNEQTEIVALDGVNPVALTKTYFRINNFSGVTAGTGLTNAGVITLRVPGPGAIQGVIDVGDGRAHQAIYTVPNGTRAFITHGEFQMLRVGSAEVVEIQLRLRPMGAADVARALFSVSAQGSSSYQRTLEYPVVVPGKTDIRLTTSFVTANNIGVSATLFFLLIDDGIF